MTIKISFFIREFNFFGPNMYNTQKHASYRFCVKYLGANGRARKRQTPCYIFKELINNFPIFFGGVTAVRTIMIRVHR